MGTIEEDIFENQNNLEEMQDAIEDLVHLLVHKQAITYDDIMDKGGCFEPFFEKISGKYHEYKNKKKKEWEKGNTTGVNPFK